MTTRKPWYRPRNIVLSVVAIALLWLGWAVFVALTARPGDRVNYAAKLNQVLRDNQPGGGAVENRWREYFDILMETQGALEAFEAELNNGEGGSVNFGSLNAVPSTVYLISEAELNDLRRNHELSIQMIRRFHESDLPTRLDELFSHGGIWEEFDPQRMIGGQTGSDFPAMRSLQTLLDGELRLAIRERRGDDAAVALRRQFKIAAIHCRTPRFDSLLIANSIIAQACEEVIDACAARPMDPRVAAMLLEELRHAPEPSMELGLESERIVAMDLIQRIYSDNGRGNGMLLQSEAAALNVSGIEDAPGLRLFNITGLFEHDRRMTVALLDTFIDGMIRQSRMSQPERQKDPFEPSRVLESEPYRSHKVLSAMFPILVRGQMNLDIGSTIANAAPIALAISIFHSEHGAYPESLDELVPAILAELPSDCFAPDGRFRYIKRVPTDDDPRPYYLYSVGHDGVDDLATPEIRDYEALTPRGAGTDCIINRLIKRYPWQE